MKKKLRRYTGEAPSVAARSRTRLGRSAESVSPRVVMTDRSPDTPFFLLMYSERAKQWKKKKKKKKIKEKEKITNIKENVTIINNRVQPRTSHGTQSEIRVIIYKRVLKKSPPTCAAGNKSNFSKSLDGKKKNDTFL